MKTDTDKLQIDFDGKPARPVPPQSPKFKVQNGPAFTLIELLVVISVIAVLAAFTISVLQSVKKSEYIKHTQAELSLLETAIQRYHDAYGFYPPGNPVNPMFSPLYFELLGTTNNSPGNPNNGTYYALDASASISGDTNILIKGFGVGGFINCTRFVSEDAPAARDFLPGLKPNQFMGNITNNGIPVTLLLGSVGGPDAKYKPLNASGLNPWRYVSPGTNNPSSYDLWIQLQISGKKYLLCNWRQVQVNSPLP